MSTSSLSGIGGFGSPGGIGGIRPTGREPPVQAVPPVSRDDQQQAQQQQQTNTAPTETERQDAVSAGRTRGSFVNITV
ncbi:MAG TPA: hypothetical protein VED40_06900 [Azospirillaceae bacterium]|nr:hypothetical protein [Azospirillaceae bacterium]